MVIRFRVCDTAGKRFSSLEGSVYSTSVNQSYHPIPLRSPEPSAFLDHTHISTLLDLSPQSVLPEAAGLPCPRAFVLLGTER